MSSSYKIIKYNCDNFECIVIPTSVNNPLEKINLLIGQLKEEHIYSGCIIFDFIFSSGNSKERYASVQYDNGFVNSSFQYIDVSKDDPIRKVCSDYLRMENHGGLLSMLNKSQISLLKSGYTL